MATIKDRYVLDIDIKGALGQLADLKGSLAALGTTRFAGGPAIIAAAIATMGAAVVNATRDFAQFERQLRLVTSSSAELQGVVTRLNDVAASTSGNFGDLAQLYTRVTLATDSLGKSQNEVIQFTENFSTAMSIAGVSAANSSGLITQLSQAMGSGVIRGDEFNSIVEALGPALNILRSETGLTVNDLRKMAENGELTSAAFFDMIANSEALSAAFQRMGVSAQQAEGNLLNAVNRALVATGLLIEDLTSIGALYTSTIQGASGALNDFARALEQITQQRRIDAFEVDTTNIEQFIAMFEDIGLAGGQAILALVDVRTRIADLQEEIDDVSLFDRLFGDDNELQAKIATLKQVEEQLNAIVQQNTADSVNRSILEQYIPADAQDRIKGYMKAFEDAKEPLERLREEQALIIEDLKKLEEAQGLGDKYGNPFGDWETAIAAAKARLEDVTAEINKIEGEGSFGEYFAQLIESSEQAVQSTEYAKWAIEDLKTALDDGVISQEVYNEALGRLNAELGNSSIQTFAEYFRDLQDSVTETVTQTGYQTEAVQELVKQYESGAITLEFFKAALDSIGVSLSEAGFSTLAYEDYLKNLSKTVEETMAMDGFKQQALADLKEQLDAGTLSVQEYDAYMRAMGETTRSVADQQRRLNETVSEFQQSSADRLQRERDQAALSGLTGLRRQLKEIELEETRLAETAKRRIQEQFPEGVNSQAQINAMREIDRAMEESIRSRSQLAEEVYNQQRTFAYGWQQAYEQYAEDAGNAAKTAQKVFEQATSGMEDAIVGFAKTGKFEWKSFVADIAETILRANIQKLLSGVFGATMPSTSGTLSKGGGGGGFLSNLFAGFFANGGTIPAGKFGVVGEAGPELVTGPATVTPMGGGGQSVQYFINAVDAPSFRALIAQDPGFIHAVASQGAKTIPGRRR